MKAATRRAARAARQARERTLRYKKFCRFILLLEEGVRTRTALRMVGLSWAGDIARWFSPMPRFAQRIRQAQEAGHQWRRTLLEDELWLRGVEGIPEPMISCGKVAAVRIRKSDSALIALARRYLPHLFQREKPAVTVEESRDIKTLIRELETGMTSQEDKT